MRRDERCGYRKLTRKVGKTEASGSVCERGRKFQDAQAAFSRRCKRSPGCTRLNNQRRWAQTIEITCKLVFGIVRIERRAGRHLGDREQTNGQLRASGQRYCDAIGSAHPKLS